MKPNRPPSEGFQFFGTLHVDAREDARADGERCTTCLVRSLWSRGARRSRVNVRYVLIAAYSVLLIAFGLWHRPARARRAVTSSWPDGRSPRRCSFRRCSPPISARDPRSAPPDSPTATASARGGGMDRRRSARSSWRSRSAREIWRIATERSLYTAGDYLEWRFGRGVQGRRGGAHLAGHVVHSGRPADCGRGRC